jgi:polygalacturonase
MQKPLVRLAPCVLALALACSSSAVPPASSAAGAAGTAGSTAGSSGAAGNDAGALAGAGVAGQAAGGVGGASTTGVAGKAGSGVAGGAAGGAAAGSAGGAAPASCDALGPEPTIPPACATLVATKTVAAGIPADDSTLDTKTIQAAIDGCAAGQAVRLTASGAMSAFLSGALMLKAGVTLWIDTGVTLFASRDPRDFEAVAGRCGGNDTGSSSCNALINAKNVANTAVVGAGTIDGRGGELVAGGTSTWWELEKADAGNLVAPRLVQVTGGNGFVLYRVTLKNAPKFHVSIQSTIGFKVWGITIDTPATSPNTDGVDPAASTNGIIAYSNISTGDDNVAIKGSGPPIVSHLVIAHNHFGKGHGMSIGSETYGGVADVSVCDLSLDGTTNGLRIKSDSSRGGIVERISYTDVCMRSVTNPFVLDAYYSTATGTRLPDFHDITARNVHVLGGGALTFRAYDAAHPLGMTFDNVVFDGSPTVKFAQDAHLTFGPGPVSFAVTGTDVTTTGAPTGTAPPRDCAAAWGAAPANN